MSAGAVAIGKADRPLAKCLVCGCDDDHACQPGGCSWSWVDYSSAVGVCSECAGDLMAEVARLRHSSCTKRLIFNARQARKRGHN